MKTKMKIKIKIKIRLVITMKIKTNRIIYQIQYFLNKNANYVNNVSIIIIIDNFNSYTLIHSQKDY